MELRSEQWLHVKELFQAMLEMDPSSRRRFLSGEEIPPELREIVQNLFDAHEEAGSFLNPQALFAEDPAFEPMRSRVSMDTVLVDRFRILRFLAKGGMGEVYEAEDLELHTRVALKTIRPEIAGYPGALNRFKREVHLAQQVTHPNVCRIFDLFRHRDQAAGDIVFLTMELLAGQTLAEILRQRGPIDTTEAITILRQVASALDAAHSAGVLHRDLKPGNIVLEPGRDGKIRAVITDFGMAWSENSNVGQPMTLNGQTAFGTPEYMSPEQIEGKTLTPASDLYSLGLVTYQMITGNRAFGANTPLISALRRLTELAPRPSRVCPDLNPEWDSVVSRCLDRNPAHRFSSAAEFAAALPANSHPSRRRLPDMRRFAQIHAWFGFRQTVAVFLAVAGIVLTGTFFVFSRREHKPAKSDSLTLVLADFVNTTGEPVFDDTLNLAIEAKLQQSPFLVLMPEAKVRLELRYMGLPAQTRLTETVAREVCMRGNGQVVLQGSIVTGDKGYRVSLRAVDCHSGNLIASESLPVEFRASVLDVLDQAADALRPRLGESLESIHKYNVPLIDATTSSLEALTAFSKGGNWNEQGDAVAAQYLRATQIDPNFALAYARLGTIYGNMGDTRRSEDAMRKAFDRRDRVTEWERFYIVSHYYGFVTGELDKEQRTYEEWAQVYPRDMAWTMNLSVDYSMTGQFDKAIELQKRAIQEIPGNSPSYVNLAQYYLAVDRPDEARSVLDQAQQLHLRDLNLQIDEYQLAYYRNDTATMTKLLATASQYPGAEDALLAQQAATEDSEGRPASARSFTVRAAAVAARAGNSEVSANWLAGEAVRQAEVGSAEQARRLVSQALAVPNAARGRDVELMAAMASAETGDRKRAATLLTALLQAHPLDTLIQSYWAPVIRARIAFSRGRYSQAARMLNGTDAYDLGVFTPGQCMGAAYLRGETLLAERQGAAAAAQFRNVLAHRGLVLNCPTRALSQLGLARSLALSGDAPASRNAYQDLFGLWKDADKDFILLHSAQAEYRALR